MADDPFDPQTPDGITARLTALREKADSRRGNPVFAVNVRAIEQEIERLEAKLASLTPDQPEG